MNDFLKKITARRAERLAQDRARLSDRAVRTAAEGLPVRRDFPFERSLRAASPGIIAEVKKASPSRGILVGDFRYLDTARRYEAAGASAISVLTEPDFFLGADRYLSEISAAVAIPTLRKDFILAERMIDEAKILGASAILLIAAVLPPTVLTDFLRRADELGLSALVEIHDEREADLALTAGARVIGVNHRNLTTFEIDFSVSERLRPRIPSDRLFVAESGLSTADDLARMRNLGVDAVLIGEAFMKSPDIAKTMKIFRREK